MKLVIVTLAILALAGCEKTETPAPDVKGKIIVTEGLDRHSEWRSTNRFTVEFQQSFNAGFGDNRRSVLILTDKRTGRQYLAITGCGVSELRTETVHHGKSSATQTVEE